jgi:predicted Zn-ribbon and HTH transcriptional regulator
MKSGSGEYRKHRDAKEARERSKVVEPRAPNRQTAPSRDMAESLQVEQRCHQCGWTGFPVRPQRCPSCNGRDALSIENFEEFLRQRAAAYSAGAQPNDATQGVPGAIGVPADEAAAETPGSPTRTSTPCLKTIAQVKREAERDHPVAHPHACEEITITEEPINMIIDHDANQLLATTEQKRIKIAADTGAFAHCAAPGDLPDSVIVEQERLRNFVGAGGESLRHYGQARVKMQQKNGGHVTNTFQVLDVIRPLHSVSMITDNGFDMLYKRGCAYVVPEGAFDKILAVTKKVAEYPREGGLWVTEMVVKDPEADPAKPASFAGQGVGQ